jgi:hypothetical protein
MVLKSSRHIGYKYMHWLAYESIKIEVVFNLIEIISKSWQVYPYNLILVLLYSWLIEEGSVQSNYPN